MVKRSRILGLVMAAVLSGTLLAGCGSKDETTTAGGQPNTAAPAAEAPGKAVKIDIIEPGNGLPSPDQDIIKQELDSKLGTDLNLTVYASGDDYKNQLNVRMASANFPDLFTVDRLQLKQFSEQGLLLDLSDYLEKLKPTIDFIGEDSLKKGMFNDRVYAIAKSPQIPYNTYWVRKDWLDKLGLQPPKTLDDLYTVAKAFTDQDPDGNGKKDTFGMTGAKLGTFSSVFGAYGIGFDGSPTMYIRDNKLVNSLHDPGMKDALTFIRKLVDAGAVDPELMANSGLQHQEKAIKGQ
ncbi:extracellular solute-binding protein, partial [Paenibacillus sepulcri]|nr:extracellular solute-binding protein [Paenibacillus sepulcri]